MSWADARRQRKERWSTEWTGREAVNFGKYAEKRWCDLPHQYLSWLSREHVEALRELRRRVTADPSYPC